MGLNAMIIVFWMLSFKPAFSLFSFTPISSRLFSSSSLFAIRVTYLRLLIFLPAILIPTSESSSPAFHMMFSAYTLNKPCDSIQSWCTPFPLWNQSVVPCPVLTVASCSAYRLLRRQVRWSGISITKNFPQFVAIHTIKGFSIVNKPVVDVFLEFPCFLYYPTNVGNLTSHCCPGGTTRDTLDENLCLRLVYHWVAVGVDGKHDAVNCHVVIRAVEKELAGGVLWF